jgi:hypothetical protein
MAFIENCEDIERLLEIHGDITPKAAAESGRSRRNAMVKDRIPQRNSR